MKDFAAIDFETANMELTSICSIGLVIVRNREIVDRIYELIKLEPEYYAHYCTQLHGLTQKDTEDKPVFSAVWKNIAPRIESLPLVAHNSFFDENCLKAVHKMYRIDYPDYEFHCTVRQSRKKYPHLINHKLKTVSTYCGFDLKNHHHALADAEACATIALNVFDSNI